MNKYIKVGDKIGYLNPKTGKYKWVEIVSFETETDSFIMCELIPVSRYKKAPNIYKEKINDILMYMKEASPDWKDGRTLLMHKSVKCNHITDAQKVFINSQSNQQTPCK